MMFATIEQAGYNAIDAIIELSDNLEVHNMKLLWIFRAIFLVVIVAVVFVNISSPIMATDEEGGVLARGQGRLSAEHGQRGLRGRPLSAVSQNPGRSRANA